MNHHYCHNNHHDRRWDLQIPSSGRDQLTIFQQATYAQFYMNQKQGTHMMKKRKGLRSSTILIVWWTLHEILPMSGLAFRCIDSHVYDSNMSFQCYKFVWSFYVKSILLLRFFFFNRLNFINRQLSSTKSIRNCQIKQILLPKIEFAWSWN
jgi:hypothetical protein